MTASNRNKFYLIHTEENGDQLAGWWEEQWEGGQKSDEKANESSC